MIGGVIFDVDGTLLDSMPIWEEAASRYLLEKGKIPEEKLGKKLFSMTMEEGAVYAKEQYCLTESVQEIIFGVNNKVMNFYANEVCLKPGVRELLETLQKRNIPMVAATASDRILIEQAFLHVDIQKHFRKLFTTSEVGKGKEHPDIFLMGAKETGASPDEIYVFEDGVYAAKTAASMGFHVVGVYDKYSEQEQEELKKTVEIYLGKDQNCNDFWQYLK